MYANTPEYLEFYLTETAARHALATILKSIEINKIDTRRRDQRKTWLWVYSDDLRWLYQLTGTTKSSYQPTVYPTTQVGFAELKETTDDRANIGGTIIGAPIVGQ